MLKGVAGVSCAKEKTPNRSLIEALRAGNSAVQVANGGGAEQLSDSMALWHWIQEAVLALQAADFILIFCLKPLLWSLLLFSSQR